MSASSAASLELVPFPEVAKNPELSLRISHGLAKIFQNENERSKPRILRDFPYLAERYASPDAALEALQSKPELSNNRYLILGQGATLGVASHSQYPVDKDSPFEELLVNIAFWIEAREHRPPEFQKRIGHHVVNLLTPRAYEQAVKIIGGAKVWTLIRPDNEASLTSFEKSDHQLKAIGHPQPFPEFTGMKEENYTLYKVSPKRA